MKLIHYTDGYGGELNYHTTCGKEIHSHDDNEDAKIDPTLVTCEDCKKTDKWKEDYGYATGETETDTKRRIYIESDVLHASELRRAQREVKDLCKEKGEDFIPRIFAEVLEYAWHDTEKTWIAVKNADEIYADSSLMPLSGGSYNGAPVIFNKMCEYAIKEKVTGKSVIILNLLEHIYWEMIDMDVMKEAFKENKLFMYDNDDELVEVDVSTIKE